MVHDFSFSSSGAFVHGTPPFRQLGRAARDRYGATRNGTPCSPDLIVTSSLEPGGSMRTTLLCCLLVVGCRAGDKEQLSGASASAGAEAERVVQRGLDAWNKHDVEGALSVYSPDAKLYRFPDKLVPNSLDSLRARWQQR